MIRLVCKCPKLEEPSHKKGYEYQFMLVPLQVNRASLSILKGFRGERTFMTIFQKLAATDNDSFTPDVLSPRSNMSAFPSFASRGHKIQCPARFMLHKDIGSHYYVLASSQRPIALDLSRINFRELFLHELLNGRLPNFCQM